MRIQKSDLSREAGRGKNLMSGKGMVSGKAGSLMSECSAARLTIAGNHQTEIFVGIVRQFSQNQVLAH